MIDREKVIRSVETCFDSWIDKHRNNGYDLQTVEQMKHDALELLKEHGPRWHTFRVRFTTDEEKQVHPNWKYVIDVDTTPNDDQEFLIYRRDMEVIGIDYWDDDKWSEYGTTGDGHKLESGDAWMELPKPPEEEQG